MARCHILIGGLFDGRQRFGKHFVAESQSLKFVLSGSTRASAFGRHGNMQVIVVLFVTQQTCSRLSFYANDVRTLPTTMLNRLTSGLA